jgi:hypothetical protein
MEVIGLNAEVKETEGVIGPRTESAADRPEHPPATQRRQTHSRTQRHVGGASRVVKGPPSMWHAAPSWSGLAPRADAASAPRPKPQLDLSSATPHLDSADIITF